MKMSRALLLALLTLPDLLCVAGAQAQRHEIREARQDSPAKGNNSLGAEPEASQTRQQPKSSLHAGEVVPRLVKFSGTLKDHLGKRFNGTLGVTFAIYRDQEGGAALWLETQNVELDEQGHYSVLLGSSKSEGLPLELFTSGEPRWLGVQVNLPKEVEQPRVLLVSVPYALKAADAETLGGKPLSSFVLTVPPSGGVVGVGTVLSPVAGATAAATIGGGGTQNVVAKFDATGANVSNSSIFDNGQVGIGTTSPGALLDVELTTSAPTNALLSNITLNNSAAINNAVVSAFDMNFLDSSTGTNLSKQTARIAYIRQAGATGGVAAFDSALTATTFLHADAPYQVREVNIEGPTVDAGKTLSNFTGLYVGSPSGAGAVSSKFALVSEPNAGNVGIGTTAPVAKLDVAGMIRVSGAGNVQITGAGNGIVAKSPDGTQCKTIGIDNTGSLVVTPYVCPVSQFTTSTFQQGSLLVMQNQTSTDTVRIGLETTWGGSIVEVSLNGTNFVNEHDTGREVQPAFYDGNAKYDNCAGCTGVFGWDPVLGGDKYDHGTPTLAQTLTSTSLYTKAQSLQWNPDDKGGGPGQPVPGDVLVEQTVTPVVGHARAFHVHYKVTHLGNDLHTNARQEFPAVYVNADYNQFVYYGGNTPWTSGAVSVTQFPVLPAVGPLLYVPEHWGAHVNAQNSGLTVYVPSQFPYVSGFDFPGPAGPTGNGTNYFAPLATLTFGPNFVFEGDVYVIAGDYPTARQIIYDLHQSVTASDIFTPIGNTDLPAGGTTISGATTVAGWTFGNVNVAKVEILVDGVLDGTATYGSPRPDVATVYPNAPLNIGFSYSLATSKYANGSHILNVRATDTTGNVAVFPNVNVTVSN